MRSTNLFIVRGHAGSDPKAFGRIAKVSVATNRSWKDAKGEWRDETDWVTLTILNEGIATWAVKNVKKGDAIYAECRVAEGSYSKNGERHFTTDIIVNTLDLIVPKVSEKDADEIGASAS